MQERGPALLIDKVLYLNIPHMERTSFSFFFPWQFMERDRFKTTKNEESSSNTSSARGIELHPPSALLLPTGMPDLFNQGISRNTKVSGSLKHFFEAFDQACGMSLAKGLLRKHREKPCSPLLETVPVLFSFFAPLLLAAKSSMFCQVSVLL